MLVLKNRAVSAQRAQAQEMNSEFNAVSVTFESRPILLLNRLIGHTKAPCTFFSVTASLRLISTTKLDSAPAFFDVPGSVIFQVLHFPALRFGPSFSSPAFSVFVLFWSAIFRTCKFSVPYYYYYYLGANIRAWRCRQRAGTE